jgi:hypothetical protein
MESLQRPPRSVPSEGLTTASISRGVQSANAVDIVVAIPPRFKTPLFSLRARKITGHVCFAWGFLQRRGSRLVLRFPRKPLRGGLNGMTWPLCSIGSGAQICPVIHSIGMRPEWRAESQPVALLILFDIAYHAAGLLPHLSDSNSGCTNEDVSPRHSVDSCDHCTSPI